MSDDIVKSLLESLTPEQKQDLIDKILNSNVKGSEPEPQQEDVSVTEDFKVVNKSKLSAVIVVFSSVALTFFSKKQS